MPLYGKPWNIQILWCIAVPYRAEEISKSLQLSVCIPQVSLSPSFSHRYKQKRRVAHRLELEKLGDGSPKKRGPRAVLSDDDLSSLESDNNEAKRKRRHRYVPLLVHAATCTPLVHTASTHR